MTHMAPNIMIMRDAGEYLIQYSMLFKLFLHVVTYFLVPTTTQVLATAIASHIKFPTFMQLALMMSAYENSE